MLASAEAAYVGRGPCLMIFKEAEPQASSLTVEHQAAGAANADSLQSGVRRREHPMPLASPAKPVLTKCPALDGVLRHCYDRVGIAPLQRQPSLSKLLLCRCYNRW